MSNPIVAPNPLTDPVASLIFSSQAPYAPTWGLLSTVGLSDINREVPWQNMWELLPAPDGVAKEDIEAPIWSLLASWMTRHRHLETKSLPAFSAQHTPEAKDIQAQDISWLLIKQGADVHVSGIRVLSNPGVAPLITEEWDILTIAFESGHHGLVQALVGPEGPLAYLQDTLSSRMGWNRQLSSLQSMEGDLPWLLACSHVGSVSLATSLIDWGVDPNTTDKRGRTALFHTTDPVMVSALVLKGVDPSHMDDADQTVVEYWASRGLPGSQRKKLESAVLKALQTRNGSLPLAQLQDQWMKAMPRETKTVITGALKRLEIKQGFRWTPGQLEWSPRAWISVHMTNREISLPVWEWADKISEPFPDADVSSDAPILALSSLALRFFPPYSYGSSFEGNKKLSTDCKSCFEKLDDLLDSSSQQPRGIQAVEMLVETALAIFNDGKHTKSLLTAGGFKNVGKMMWILANATDFCPSGAPIYADNNRNHPNHRGPAVQFPTLASFLKEMKNVWPEQWGDFAATWAHLNKIQLDQSQSYASQFLMLSHAEGNEMNSRQDDERIMEWAALAPVLKLCQEQPSDDLARLLTFSCLSRLNLAVHGAHNVVNDLIWKKSWAHKWAGVGQTAIQTRNEAMDLVQQHPEWIALIPEKSWTSWANNARSLAVSLSDDRSQKTMADNGGSFAPEVVAWVVRNDLLRHLPTGPTVVRPRSRM